MILYHVHLKEFQQNTLKYQGEFKYSNQSTDLLAQGPHSQNTHPQLQGYHSGWSSSDETTKRQRNVESSVATQMFFNIYQYPTQAREGFFSQGIKSEMQQNSLSLQRHIKAELTSRLSESRCTDVDKGHKSIYTALPKEEFWRNRRNKEDH